MTTTLQHHPDHATLMSFAAGALPEALSAVISTHLVACAECRETVRQMEDVGSALMLALDVDSAQPCASDQQAAMIPPSAEMLAKIDADTADDQTEFAGDTPQDPITALVGVPLADVRWKRLGLGVWHYPIKLTGDDASDLRLIKVQPGQSMPEHGHGGSELTLVLDGAYHDTIGTFRAGDVADLDDSVEHRPVADPDLGCICLIASEKKARFTGLIGRLLQPIAGI